MSKNETKADLDNHRLTTCNAPTEETLCDKFASGDKEKIEVTVQDLVSVSSLTPTTTLLPTRLSVMSRPMPTWLPSSPRRISMVRMIPAPALFLTTFPMPQESENLELLSMTLVTGGLPTTLKSNRSVT